MNRYKTGEDIQLKDFTDPDKRADFVLSNEENVIQIIEIKRPKHRFENIEMERLNRYIEQMTNFLGEDSHRDFTKVFRGFHVTLVCDEERLTGLAKSAFKGLRESGQLTYISWTAFLHRTRKMHQDFLNEADKQKRNAVQEF